MAAPIAFTAHYAGRLAIRTPATAPTSTKRFHTCTILRMSTNPQPSLPTPLSPPGSSISHQHPHPTTYMKHKPIMHKGMHHAGMLVSNTEKSMRFYMDVLGMDDVTHLRHTLPFPGAFVQAGNHQIHLMELESMDPKVGRPEHGGRDKHVALTVSDITPLMENLDKNGIFYTMSKSGRRALFCRDPDGNALEFIEVKE